MNQLPWRIHPGRSALLVVDLQEKLLAAIPDGPRVLDRARRFIEAARILKVPILVSEQYPKGIGPTCAVIKAALGDTPIMEKMAFSSCGAAAFAEAWKKTGADTAIVTGVECHVCVQQTTLDLLAKGTRVVVLADAVASRNPFDRDIALDRIRQAGAIVSTTESVLFEMLERAGTAEFKEVLKLVK